MAAALSFIFSDFWYFVGTCVLVAIATQWEPIHIHKEKNENT